MLKRKLKKVLIILLLLVMVVQICPVTYAATDEWNNMTEKKKQNAVLDIKGGDDYQGAIDDFLSKYDIDINELNSIAETLKENGKYDSDFDFRKTYIALNNIKHGRDANTGIENLKKEGFWGRFFNGIEKFFTGIDPTSTQEVWENLPDNEKWEIMTKADKLDLIHDFSAGTVNDRTIKEFIEKYGITATDFYEISVSLDAMFPEDPQYDGLVQTKPEQLVEGSVEIIQNGSTDVGDENTIGNFIDGIAGVLFIGIKILPAIAGKALSWIMDKTSGEKITIYNVLFNKVDLTSINFFDSTSGSSTVDNIKQNVAIWYVGIRNLAAIILALILIYVAIRMAVTTIAEDKAKYKTMLIDWLTSLCLLFVLHYIMIFTININNTLVNLLSGAGSSIDLTSIENTLFGNAITSRIC